MSESAVFTTLMSSISITVAMQATAMLIPAAGAVSAAVPGVSVMRTLFRARPCPARARTTHLARLGWVGEVASYGSGGPAGHTARAAGCAGPGGHRAAADRDRRRLPARRCAVGAVAGRHRGPGPARPTRRGALQRLLPQRVPDPAGRERVL